MDGACSRKKEGDNEDNLSRVCFRKYCKCGSLKWWASSFSYPSMDLRAKKGECPSLLDLCVQKISEVKRVLDVVQKLIRASPDELKHAAKDLTRSLLQVRCCDIALEGEEESTEDKRQRALIALAVTCPFESLDTLHNLLYSPNIDISQHIMILDVMTEQIMSLLKQKLRNLNTIH
ncbi:hypothetical protein RYX36_005101 [Vicia faba]